jgi:hypothetical protein
MDVILFESEYTVKDVFRSLIRKEPYHFCGARDPTKFGSGFHPSVQLVLTVYGKMQMYKTD